MTIPLWGHEATVSQIADRIQDRSRSIIVDIVAAPGAPQRRFVASIVKALRQSDVDLCELHATPACAVTPGRLADDATGAGVVVLDDAHSVDDVSLGRLLRHTLTSNGALLLARSDDAQRRFDRLAATAGKLGAYRLVSLSAPTIDDIADGLGIERDAAAALHAASGADDAALVAALDELGSDGPIDLAAFLSGLATDASPTAGLSETELRLTELVGLAIEPVTAATLSAASGIAERETLNVVDQLATSGYVIDTARGIEATERAGKLIRGLSQSRQAAGHRALADTLASASDNPLTVGSHYAAAGMWDEAFAAFREAATGDGANADVATDRALDAIDNGATTDATVRGRLLLSRAQTLRFSAYSDEALADLNEASSLLTGAERVDALAFLASVLDDQQLPQEADVAVARAEWEAIQLGALDKLGSLTSLRARFSTRLGFAGEADHMLTRASELVDTHGTSRQLRNIRNNRAWIAFDRGEAARSEQLFGDLVETGSDATSDTDARAWHARALAARGWAQEAAEEIAAVRAHADDHTTGGAQFLAAIAAHERAMRMGQFDAALEATDLELGYVSLFLPAWENGVSFRRADALRALGRFDEASEAVERSLATSPAGANGDRWSSRAEILRRRIDFETNGTWDQRWAEDLTDRMLHASWYTAAVELMVLRATAQNSNTLSDEAAALAMGLGDPVSAAAAVAARDRWSEHPEVARAVQGLASHVAEDEQASWMTLPGISTAMDVRLDDTVETPDWHGELQSWLDEAGLGSERVSPAQRRDRQLVRRSAAPRRWGVVVLAASIAAAMVLVTMIGLITNGFFSGDPLPTTTVVATAATTVATTTATTIPLSVEETLFAVPENGLFGSVEFLGGLSHNNVATVAGLTSFDGYYWENTDIGVVVAQPVIQGRLLYVGDRNGDIHVISLNNGIALKRYRMNDDIEAPLVVGSFRLGEGGQPVTRGYAVDVSGTVKLFDANDLLTPDGYALGIRTTAGPIVITENADSIPSAIVLASHDGRVRALDIDLNNELRVFPALDQPALGRIDFTPAFVDGRLFIVDADGILTVLDATTFEMICSQSTRQPATAAPVVVDDRVWVPTGDAIRIFDIDCRQPPADERIEIPADARTTPVLQLPIAYIADGSVLLAHDTQSDANIAEGESADLWAKSARGNIESSPVVSNGVIYYGDNGTLTARRVGDGTIISSYEIGARMPVSPLIIENAIIIAVNGRIVAIAGSSS